MALDTEKIIADLKEASILELNDLVTVSYTHLTLPTIRLV